MTNHVYPGHFIEQETVGILLANSPKPRKAYLERIDEQSANPKKIWKRKGSPEYLSKIDIQELEEHSQMKRSSMKIHYKWNSCYFVVDMPPHSVASITILF
jgi:hypothetical protein